MSGSSTADQAPFNLPDDGERGPRVPIATVAKLLALAFVVHTFVIPQIGGARAALKTVSDVSPALVGLALILEAGALVAYAALTKLLLPKEPPVGLGYCTGVVVASTGINHVLPGGAATTAAVNFRLLGRLGIPGPKLGFALGAQAIGSAVVLNILLWCALLISIPASGFHPVYATAAAAGALLLIVLASAVVGLQRGRERLAAEGSRLVGRLPGIDAGAVERGIRQSGAHLDTLIHTPGLLWQGALLAALNWLLDAAALWTMVAAFGYRPSVVGVLVAYGLANVIGALPFSPGGLGIVEAVLIPSLISIGTNPSIAAVAVVAYRLISFWLPIPVGLASFAVLLRREAPAPEARPNLGAVLDDVRMHHGELHLPVESPFSSASSATAGDEH
jgi:putative heme transporter